MVSSKSSGTDTTTVLIAYLSRRCFANRHRACTSSLLLQQLLPLLLHEDGACARFDEADEMEDERDRRDESDTMDSGEDAVEMELATDERRARDEKNI
jgi:hypothetical protein